MHKKGKYISLFLQLYSSISKLVFPMQPGVAQSNAAPRDCSAGKLQYFEVK